MMPVSEAAGALVGLVGLINIIAIIYGRWQAMCRRYTVDVIEQQRWALFDMARAGRLSFESESYEILRATLTTEIKAVDRRRFKDLAMDALRVPRWIRRPRRSDRQFALDMIADSQTRTDVADLLKIADSALLRCAMARAPFVLGLPCAAIMCLAAAEGRLNTVWSAMATDLAAEIDDEEYDFSRRS